MRARALLLASLLTLLLAFPVGATAQPCNETLSQLFERVSPAVVSIQATKINKIKPQRRFETIVGSGVIIERDGQILTNAHVVDGAASLTVTLDNGSKVTGRILGLDTVLDLALVRVESPGPLPAAKLGDSSSIKVGDEVVAIGNPIGLDQTMTRGIVSGLNRILPGVSDEAMIQTDAPINPGNSGGPLVDRCGQVIGINTLISEDAQSIGFAVPINAARTVLREMRDSGRVVRPWLGLQGRAVEAPLGSIVRMPITPGYLVEIVLEGSPADQAGIRGGSIAVVVQGEEYLLGGDIVTAIQGTPIRTHQDYVTKVRTLKPGQRVKVSLVRDGQARELTLTVTERPRLPTDLSD
jgi:S1-C subfamily serine protease